MSGVWGKNIKLSIFGESHGKGVGVVVDGLPPGLELDIDYIKKEMKRRAPGKNEISTPRSEGDEFEIISGYFNNKTTGVPLCVVIWNTNTRSKDYDSIKNVMRPGHGDYPGAIKYKGFSDYRGGGHFSGRLTAALVFAGAIAKQILGKEGILIGAHIKSIGNIRDEDFEYTSIEDNTIKELNEKEFPVINDSIGKKMKEVILKAKGERDSVGGVIEATAINVPGGIGSPFFDSVESRLSHIIFSIPGVKGIEFGAGFSISEMKGSKANDEYYLEDNKIKTYSNNNGGITGGITNGMPLNFRVAFKPTPSIGKSQRSVDIKTNEDIKVEIEGRHDPCIVPRALPVVEACTAITILDLILDSKKA